MAIPDPERAARFSRIYEAFYGRIHAYAARRVGAASADEIAAETFLVAWRRFDVMPQEPLPWLYGVARNLVRRHQVQHARQEAARDAVRSERVLSDQPTEAESSDVWTAWSRLSNADREILALIAWEELAVHDAAKVLGCTTPVFSVRLHRARKRFERLLTGETTASRPVTTLSEAS
jgi:RNA polymerase sigma-70 factor (ECF subfamily)